MKTFKVSVKEVVGFLYSSGDLSSEFSSNSNLLDGKKIHNKIQKSFKNDDLKEVFVKHTYENIEENYKIIVSGFIDGVLLEHDEIIILEIKSTYTSLDDITMEYHKEYFSQLLFYAYMYAYEHKLGHIKVRLLYVAIHNDDLMKQFDFEKSFKELEEFYISSVKEYAKFYMHLDEALELKVKSIEHITFPFEGYRDGQRLFMKAIYQTMLKQDILYALAPTGIGKTIATLFSTLKSISKKEEKVFYLTSKTVLKQVALKACIQLNEGGLVSKCIEITAKDKMCVTKDKNCDPNVCIYAKSFFNKLKDATFDLFAHEQVFDYQTLNKYAIKHEVCPFEFSLHMSYYADIIICDYNYAFDPKAHLIRYFDSNEFILKILVDESHNLVSRSREMFSATITKKDFDNLMIVFPKHEIKGLISKIYEIISPYQDESFLFMNYESIPIDLINAITKINFYLEEIIQDRKIENNQIFLDFYFRFKDFLDTSERFGNNFSYIVEKEGDVSLTIQCLDASSYILQTLKRASGSVLFSATLQPIDYYKRLLTNNEGFHIMIPSPFDVTKQLVLCRPISTRYNNRKQSSRLIVETILSTVSMKKGNYMVFFPSYQYMDMIYEIMPQTDYDIYIQKKDMDEFSKKDFFDTFNDKENTKLGFFVLGGAFGEGVDFEDNAISGTIIVGVGMPMINHKNDVYKKYFDEYDNNGFDYTYTYPGFSKVIQAAGRVIRDVDDVGIVVLIDDRYLTSKYLNLAPTSFSNFKVCHDVFTFEMFVKKFWKGHGLLDD